MATLAAWNHRSFTGEVIDPMELIPPRLKPTDKSAAKTEAQENRETQASLMMLEQALRGML